MGYIWSNIQEVWNYQRFCLFTGNLPETCWKPPRPVSGGFRTIRHTQYVVHSNLRIWVITYFEAKKIEKKMKKITTLFSKNWKKILPLKTWENCPQKLLIIGPIYFVSTDLATQTAQKQKHRTTKSPLMQDWVFRLGCWTTPGPWLN